MTEEEIRAWCDERGMSYPGTLAGLFGMLLARVEFEASKVQAARNDKTALMHDVEKALDGCGDESLSLVPRLEAFVRSTQNSEVAEAVQRLRRRFPAQAVGRSDGQFLDALEPRAPGAFRDMEEDRLRRVRRLSSWRERSQNGWPSATTACLDPSPTRTSKKEQKEREHGRAAGSMLESD